jgi:hypothetical protein
LRGFEIGVSMIFGHESLLSSVSDDRRAGTPDIFYGESRLRTQAAVVYSVALCQTSAVRFRASPRPSPATAVSSARSSSLLTSPQQPNAAEYKDAPIDLVELFSRTLVTDVLALTEEVGRKRENTLAYLRFAGEAAAAPMRAMLQRMASPALPKLLR